MASPDFDDDYLRMEGQPSITLKQQGKQVTGEYHVGFQQGGIDGRVQDIGQVVFSFAGMDELDEVGGAGTITMSGDRLTFTLMYHQGDDFSFECVRRT